MFVSVNLRTLSKGTKTTTVKMYLLSAALLELFDVEDRVVLRGVPIQADVEVRNNTVLGCYYRAISNEDFFRVCLRRIPSIYS